MAEIKHPRHEEVFSGVKGSKACLMSEAESRRREQPQELALKKIQALLERTKGTELQTAANDIKIGYKGDTRDAVNRVQQELPTKENEQKRKLLRPLICKKRRHRAV